MHTSDPYDEEDYARARRRVKEKKQYFQGLGTYVAVISFLAFINLYTAPGYLWFLWPAAGWGLGIAIQTIKIFGTSRVGDAWEDREMERELRRRKKKAYGKSLPAPRRDLLDERDEVRNRLDPRPVRRDYGDDEFV